MTNGESITAIWASYMLIRAAAKNWKAYRDNAKVKPRYVVLLFSTVINVALLAAAIATRVFWVSVSFYVVLVANAIYVVVLKLTEPKQS